MKKKRKTNRLTRLPGNSSGMVEPGGPFPVATSIGSVIGFIGGGSSKSSSPSSPPFCSRNVGASPSSSSTSSSSSPSETALPDLSPVGNLNRLSDPVFLSGGGRSATTAVVDFSTLPWLSLRKGGGNHFRLESQCHQI